MLKKFTILWSLFFVLIIQCYAQKNDSLPERRNIIKINLVSSFLYSGSGAMSFERMVKPNQSFAIMLGYVKFPSFGSIGDSATASDAIRNNGIVVGGEYRFYLKKENKYAGPHGVYIGPYANYFNFDNDRSIAYSNSNGTTTNGHLATAINVLNIGIEIGYQFVINNRWTFDMVFIGPSVSHYSLTMDLKGFDITQEDIIASEILSALTAKFPIVKDLLADQKVDAHGTTSHWGAGFRYQINVGYCFGRNKK